MNNKLVIFDFDGVLADSFEHVYEINRLVAELVGKELTKDEYQSMFLNKSFHKSFFKFLSLNEEELERVLSFKYKIYDNYYSKTRLYGFVPELIKVLFDRGVKMSIVSSAHEDSIKNILKKNNLLNYFECIFGMNKFGKVENLKKCIKLCNVKEENSYFVTDTVGDLREGKTLKLRTIAVTWGFHDKDMIGKIKATHVVSQPEEINTIILN